MTDEDISGELVDPVQLARWLDVQGLEVGAPITLTTLVAGRSNAMFTVERGGSRWVLRRPGLVAVDRADEGMRREFRILDALRDTDVPHPRVVALCDDHEVLGRTFYLMEHVDGIAPSPPLPPPFADADRAGVSFALVDALASLHDVDWRAIGLGDLGRPEGFHERQVERWSRQLASYDGREMPGMDRVTAYLSADVPTSFVPTIMHGDYHMFNVMIAPEPPGRVVAIVDWETATIGDPLLDLVGFCEIWGSAAPAPDWPGREELIARYRSRRSVEIPESLDYYSVLYNFRMSVLLEGIYQRSRQVPSRSESEEMGETAMGFLRRAVAIVDGT